MQEPRADAEPDPAEGPEPSGAPTDQGALDARSPDAGGLDPEVLERSEPFWARTQGAWVVAIAVGFAGSWVGLVAQGLILATVVATLGFAVLFLALHRRGRGQVASLAGLAWIVAIAVAHAGFQLENPDVVVIPRALLHGPFDPTGAWDAPARVPWHLGLVLVLAVLGRPLAGILLVVCVGALASTQAAVSGLWVQNRLETTDTDPLLAILSAWPPPSLITLAAALVAGSTLTGGGGNLRAMSDLDPTGRRWILFSLGIAAVVALAAPLYGPAWKA